MLSLRQTLTPAAMLGRINAATRLVSWGAIPLGALIGGGLGEAIGVRQTLVTCAGGSMLVVAWVALALRAARNRQMMATGGRWVHGRLLYRGGLWSQSLVVARLRASRARRGHVWTAAARTGC